MKHLFLRAYTAVAQMLSQKTGVKIVTGANGFSTDGKAVFMPTVDAESIGPLIHEIGHVVGSDFSLKFGSAIEKHVNNLLEDIRIEQLMSVLYPGAGMYLAEMVERFVGNGFFSAPEDDEPSQLMMQYMLYRLRADVLGQVALLEYSNTAEQLLRAKVSHGAFVRLEALMYGVEKAQSEREVQQLAIAIIKMMEEEAKKEEEERAQNQQPDPNQGQQSDDSQASAGGGQGDDQQNDQNQAQDGLQTGGQGDNQQDGQAQPQGSGAADEGEQSFWQQVLSAGDDDGLADVKDALVQASQQAVDEGRVDTVGMPFNTTVIEHPTSPVASSMLEEVEAATNALRIHTRALLQAETKATKRHKMQGTRIDPRKLHRAPTGGAIFQKVTPGKKTETAIMVLVDRSGSMQKNGRIHLATKAALASTLAFDYQGVETAVMAFPYQDSNALLKGWKDRSAAQADKYESIGVEGCTPMAEAMMGACIELAQHKYQRKILLVATDGEPDNRSATRDVISLARRSGIEVIGMGIEIDVTRVFDEKFSTCVNDVDDLPSSMLSVLRTAVFN